MLSVTYYYPANFPDESYSSGFCERKRREFRGRGNRRILSSRSGLTVSTLSDKNPQKKKKKSTNAFPHGDQKHERTANGRVGEDTVLRHFSRFDVEKKTKLLPITDYRTNGLWRSAGP